MNYPFCDLMDLRANAMYPKIMTERRISTLIEKTVAKAGWLIFYTHDVSNSPTEWGTPPALLEYAVKEAVTSGCRILPVSKVVDEFSSKMSEANLAVDRLLDNRSVPSVHIDDCALTIIAIVGYRNPQDVRACISALANSIEKNFRCSFAKMADIHRIKCPLKR